MMSCSSRMAAGIVRRASANPVADTEISSLSFATFAREECNCADAGEKHDSLECYRRPVQTVECCPTCILGRERLNRTTNSSADLFHLRRDSELRESRAE